MTLLEADGVTKRFGGLTAVSRFSVQIAAGEIAVYPHLRKRFKEAEKIMEMLHGFADQEVLQAYARSGSPILRDLAVRRLPPPTK